MSQDRNTNRPAGRRRHRADRVTRASQTRLVILVGLFVMVLAMMQHARQPSTWQWMWRMNHPGVPAEVDPRLRPNPPTGRTGRFVASRERDFSAKVDDSLGLTISPERWDDIRDDTYFRPAEKDTWFHLFSILQNATNDELEKESLGGVSALQLYRQPDAYRGKLVDVRGTVHRAHRLIAPQNDQEIRSYWQLWLFEGDGVATPCVVYVLEMPNEFPEGMNVEEPVELTGFSYKRWAYQGSEGDLMVAPVVLAKNILWIRTEPASRPSVSSDQVFWSVALALALSVIMVRWALIWSGRSARRRAMGGDGDDESADFNFLERRDSDGGS